jgi:hypothetical protein
MELVTEEQAAQAALHAYINDAEELARWVRLASKGRLTLTVAHNRAPLSAADHRARDRAGLLKWGQAHDVVDGSTVFGAPLPAAVRIQAAAEYAHMSGDDPLEVARRYGVDGAAVALAVNALTTEAVMAREEAR